MTFYVLYYQCEWSNKSGVVALSCEPEKGWHQQLHSTRPTHPSVGKANETRV